MAWPRATPSWRGYKIMVTVAKNVLAFMVTVTDNVITVTVTANKRNFPMNNTVRFLQVVTDSNLSWFPFSLGTNFPIMRETKTYWIINILGDVEKKVMKSTFRLAGCKDSPLFGVYEPEI